MARNEAEGWKGGSKDKKNKKTREKPLEASLHNNNKNRCASRKVIEKAEKVAGEDDTHLQAGSEAGPREVPNTHLLGNRALKSFGGDCCAGQNPQ